MTVALNIFSYGEDLQVEGSVEIDVDMFQVINLGNGLQAKVNKMHLPTVDNGQKTTAFAYPVKPTTVREIASAYPHWPCKPLYQPREPR
jgi:hypothetical protein